MSDISRVKLTNVTVIDVDNGSPEKSAAAYVVSNARKAFNSRKTKSYEFRKKQLKNLSRFLKEEEETICKALWDDLKKPTAESLNHEINIVVVEIANTLSKLKSWMEPERPKKYMVNCLDDIEIHKDPYGVVLVMGAWNFPVNVLLLPVVGAIAAGNCVVLKPSELAASTARVLATYLPKYLDSECYPVYLGGVDETTELLKQKFDYIFFTGSSIVGKIIHQAASKFLTPTTLELGGKSAVYLDSSANLEMAAKRIMWGKLQNCGQICIAPDYLLCSKEIQNKFISYAEMAVKDFYGDKIETNPDYGRIISKKHFERLTNLLKNQNVAFGGNYNEDNLYIQPTILIDVDARDPVMQEEIFGPILPIINVENYENAIDFINDREKPLALYIFTDKKKVKQAFLENTSSGGVVINDVIMHCITGGLPFGGVGNSGMGSYHGKSSFDTFVHKKSVLIKSFMLLSDKIESIRYPPYTKFKTDSLSTVVRIDRPLPTKYIPHLLMFVLGIAVTICSYFIYQYSTRRNS